MDDTIEPALPPVAPGNEPLTLVPAVLTAPTEDEVVAMLVEQSRFSDEPGTRATAARLLAAGYTVHSVARKLKLRAVTVWSWSTEPEIAESIAKGKELRAKSLGQGLEDAAEDALSTLVSIANDTAVNPRDRVKASEAILDRCGMVSTPESTQTAIAVDIDFDERLARIVAGAKK